MGLRQMGGEPIRRPQSIDQADKKQLHVEELSGFNSEQLQYIRKNLKNALTHKGLMGKFQDLFSHDNVASLQNVNASYSGDSGRMFEVRDGDMSVGFIALKKTVDGVVIEHLRTENGNADAMHELLLCAQEYASGRGPLMVNVHEDAAETIAALRAAGFDPTGRTENNLVTFQCHT